jgi:hypothetical protein
VLYLLVSVPVVARAGATGARPSAKTTGRITSLRRARDDPLPVVALVRVMPTSRSWSCELRPIGASCGDLPANSIGKTPSLLVIRRFLTAPSYRSAYLRDAACP